MVRLMADNIHREQQWERRYAPNIEEVNRFCDTLKTQKSRELPYVDPIHDSDDCRIISLFSNPGSGVESGFLSSENDDSSAARMAEIYAHVGLRPEHVMPWNVYPWYVYDEQKGKLDREQINEGLKPLLKFIQRVPRASAIVAHGADAHKMTRALTKAAIPTIRRRGFKFYEVRATSDRAFIGSVDKQEAWLQGIYGAYGDAMSRAGIAQLKYTG